MEHLAEYWAVFLVLAAACCVGVVYVREFMNRPTSEQIAAVKEWLVWAVTNAEKELGGGTGRLKLRQVYDLFVQRFPIISRMIPFNVFSGWVDEALAQMKSLLATNVAVKEYVLPDGTHFEK